MCQPTNMWLASYQELRAYWKPGRVLPLQSLQGSTETDGATGDRSAINAALGVGVESSQEGTTPV